MDNELNGHSFEQLLLVCKILLFAKSKMPDLLLQIGHVYKVLKWINLEPLKCERS